VSVYFITCRKAKAVKIGNSVDPHGRLAEIQLGCPLPVVLEAIMPGNASEEFRLHRWFAEERIRGEWFQLTPMIELLIKEHAVLHFAGVQRRVSKPRQPKGWHLKSAEERYTLLMADMRGRIAA
jgi:hypothetical protein